MDAKYLAEIKKDANRLVKLADNPYCQGPVSLLDGVKRVVPALLAEVERLTDLSRQNYCKFVRQQEECAAKDQQIATLKKALERAEEHINEIYSYLDYDYCGSCQQVKEAVEDYRYGVHQAKEQEGKK